MGILSIYKPTGRTDTNIFTNPSTEIDTTSWGTAAGTVTLTRDIQRATRGAWSLRAIPVAASPAAGLYQQSATALASSTGGYVRTRANVYVESGSANVYYTATYTGGGTLSAGTSIYAAGTSWNSFDTSLTLPGTATLNFVNFYAKANTSAGGTFHIDALDGRWTTADESAYTDSYVDGDQPGCAWTGVSHASTSTRSHMYRSGGLLQDIETYTGAIILAVSGLGPMPHVVLTRSYSTIPGDVFDGFHQDRREITIILGCKSSTLAGLHEIRRKLNDLFLPGRVFPVEQPLRLRYTGSTTPVEFDAYYDGGLEGDIQGGNANYEKIAIKLRAADPFVYESGNPSHTRVYANATISTSIGSFISKSTSGWANVSASLGTTAIIKAILPVTGGWIVGGDFTNLGGNADCDYIAKVSTDGTISPCSTGLTGGIVYKIVQWTSTTAIVVGAFTGANGVSNTRGVCQLNLSTLALTAIDGGCDDGAAYDCVIDSSGRAYIGGSFTAYSSALSYSGYLVRITAAGVAQAIRAATVSQNSEADAIDVTCLAISTDGKLWIGGHFGAFSGSGSTTVNICRYSISTPAFWGLGGGTNVEANLRSIASIGSGRVAIAGEGMTTAGTRTVYNCAYWSSTGWAPYGIGFNDDVEQLYWDGTKLWAVGAFTTGGSVTSTALNGIAYYDGGWHNYDGGFPSGDKARAIAISGSTVYLGCNGAVTAGTTYQTGGSTAIVNSGTASAKPKFFFPHIAGTSGTATVTSITNETTGQRINLNHGLISGETFVVDLDYQPNPLTEPTAGRQKIYSDTLGDLPGDLESGSDLADFALVPGTNMVSVYIAETGGSAAGTAQAAVQFRITHDSADV